MNPWRIAAAALLVLLPLAGLLTGSRACYVLFAFLLLLLLAALAQNLWAAFTFRYLQTLDVGEISRGSQVHLKLAIDNEKPFPYALMRIRLATADRWEDRRLDFDLPPKQRADFDLTLECPHRGAYEVGMTIIDFVDLFGLLRLPFDMRVLSYYRMRSLVVLPKVYELDRLPLRSFDNKSFAKRAPPTDDPEEPFAGIRPYRPGDSRRLIHWKATARHGVLLTRQFEPTEEMRIRLLVDVTAPPHAGKEAAQAEDALCEGIASVVRYLLRKGTPLELVTHAPKREAVHALGMRDFTKIRRWLATLPFTGARPLEEQLQLEMPTLGAVRSFLVFTTDLQPSAMQTLLRLKDRAAVNVLLGGPVVEAGRVRETATELRRNGIQAWAIRYGEDPGETFGGES
jgi:uncharacterized protein (DUF58 family)